LGATSLNITDELEKLQSSSEISNKKKDSSKESDQQQLKKPTTSLIVKSKNEYTSNFKAVISQNLKIKTKIGGDKANLSETLVKLVLNNCELKNIDPSIFDLINLTHLDISSNKLSKIDNFILERLEELNLSQNEIVFIGPNCRTPRLTSLDLSFNKLTKLDKNFCLNFKTIAKLRVTNNVLHTFWSNFGYSFMSLKNFYASNNQLRFLPYSCSHLRLEMLEMHDNPFEFKQMGLNLNTELKKFPTMVEICARQVLNKK
jgi:Leucine-rich repeat (LRR) protein